jgi:anti-sigma factor RsiW
MLLSYLHGELPDTQSAEVAAHIRDCPACADEEANVRREIALFGLGISMPAAPPYLEGAVMSRLEGVGLGLWQRQVAGIGRWRRTDPVYILRACALTVASVCLAIAGLAFIWPAAGDALVSGAARLGSELTRYAGQRSPVLPGLVRAAGALLNLAGL